MRIRFSLISTLLLAAAPQLVAAQDLTGVTWTVSSLQVQPPHDFYADLEFETQVPAASDFALTGYCDWVHPPPPAAPTHYGRSLFEGTLTNTGMLEITDLSVEEHPVHGGPVGIGLETYSAVLDPTESLITQGQWPATGQPAGTFMAWKNEPGIAFCFGWDCSCSNDALAGCANSTGAGAVLAAIGSPSVSADNLGLFASGVSPDQNGVLFMGGGIAPPQVFGDGQLCVSPGPSSFCRFPIQNSGSLGLMQEGPGIVAFSLTQPMPCQINAGDTWNFQCWYRDPQGPCGGLFNLSNGVSVAFTP